DLARVFEERLVPVPRSVRPLIQLVQSSAGPQAVGDLKVRQVRLECDRIWTIRLNLYRGSSGALGFLENSHGQVKFAVVVSGHFCNHKRGASLAYVAAINRES